MNSSRTLRWAVPVVAVGLVAGAVVLPAALAADRPAALAPRTAAQLLVDLSAQRATSLSGTVVQTSRLGLPELPGAGGTTGPASLATGSHTLRVWADGPERQRVALLGSLAEYDVVRSGRDVWTYSSGTDEAVHVRLPARPGGAAGELPVPAAGAQSPADAAAAALAAIDPTTQVAVDDAVVIAGRTARQLVLVPRGGQSLVGSVRLAVDAATSAPLRVQVFSAADPATPALEVGFTDVRFTAPDRSVFAFSPPPGATVTDKTAKTLPEPREPAAGPEAKSGPARPAGGQTPTVVGAGWSAVLVVTGVDPAATGSPLLDQVTTRVPEGRLLTTALLSVLLTDDGRLLVGAVPPAVLRAAA